MSRQPCGPNGEALLAHLGRALDRGDAEELHRVARRLVSLLSEIEDSLISEEFVDGELDELVICGEIGKGGAHCAGCPHAVPHEWMSPPDDECNLPCCFSNGNAVCVPVEGDG